MRLNRPCWSALRCKYLIQFTLHAQGVASQSSDVDKDDLKVGPPYHLAQASVT